MRPETGSLRKQLIQAQLQRLATKAKTGLKALNNSVETEGSVQLLEISDGSEYHLKYFLNAFQCEVILSNLLSLVNL